MKKERQKTMYQIDKKALYIKQGYTTNRSIIQSYATPICIIDNNKIITSDKKYSTTTSKHKSYVINTLYRGYQVITIPHKTLKQIMIDEEIDTGRM
jgi:hypothetical protein